jgi:hypothetical protein
LTWLVLLAALPSFALGWVAGVWQCSRRRECPRYAEHALARWKQEVVEPAVRRGRRRPFQSRPTPVEGGES